MRPALLAPILALALAPTLPAQELHAEWIPDEARWVAHVDLAGLLSSTTLSFLEDELDVDWDADLGEVETELGLDVRRDVQAVTVYGTTDDPETAVVLVSTGPGIDDVLARLAGRIHRSEVEEDGIGLMRFSESESSHDAVFAYLAREHRGPGRILMVSPHAGHLARGVEVLRGGAASLADGPGALPVSPSTGTLVYVAAGEMLAAYAHDEATSRIARLARSAVVEVGELDEELFAHLTVETEHDEAARQVAAILQGGQALMQLIASSEPDVAAAMPLLQGLRIDVEDDRVHVRFRQRASVLRELVRSGGHRPSSTPRTDGEAGDEDEGDADGKWY